MGFLLACVFFLGVLYFVNKLSCFWCKSKVCLVEKTAVVVGGVTGIGYETALALAARGCKIIIADVADSAVAVNSIKETTKNKNVIGMFVDLASFKSIKKFAEEILKSEEKLDILICNAGIGNHEDRSKTQDGIIKLMQVNYFGHIVLIRYLLGLLKKSAPSRIVFTSSCLAYLSYMQKDDINPSEAFYKTFYSKYLGGAYNNSKLCLAAATMVLAQKLKGTGVTVNACILMGVKTRIFMHSFKQNHNIMNFLIWILTQVLGKSVEEGAQTLIHLASSQEVSTVSGELFWEGRPILRPIPLTKDFCQHIWIDTMKLCKMENF